MEQLINQYMDPDVVRVVQGAVAETAEVSFHGYLTPRVAMALVTILF